MVLGDTLSVKSWFKGELTWRVKEAERTLPAPSSPKTVTEYIPAGVDAPTVRVRMLWKVGVPLPG